MKIVKVAKYDEDYKQHCSAKYCNDNAVIVIDIGANYISLCEDHFLALHQRILNYIKEKLSD